MDWNAHILRDRATSSNDPGKVTLLGPLSQSFKSLEKMAFKLFSGKETSSMPSIPGGVRDSSWTVGIMPNVLIKVEFRPSPWNIITEFSKEVKMGINCACHIHNPGEILNFIPDASSGKEGKKPILSFS
jgi:hypothetical protein